MESAAQEADRGTQKEARQLVIYDLGNHQGLDPFEHVLLVTALQGLVNREEPRLYVRYVHERSGLRRNVDDYWLAALTQDGEWLAGVEMEPVDSLLELLERFSDAYRGVVAWDRAVPATMNAATTAAGVEGLLPVPFGRGVQSLWQQLVVHGPRLPVERWLVDPDGRSLFTGKGTIPGTARPSTGSAKADVYIWALETYLKTGRVSPGLLGYFLDSYYTRSPGAEWSHAVSNRDYLVANRGFVFDLSPWADEAPNDDPTQPLGTDYRTLLEILHVAYQHAGGGLIKIVGFVPWGWKYTTVADPKSRHDPVPSEWEFKKIASAFNGYVEADAHDKSGIGAMANASVYQHYPLADHYPQNPKPDLEALKAKGYVSEEGTVAPKLYYAFYVGDYDSPAWLYQVVPEIWDDPARGSVPLTWAFNPNLADRMAPAMVYTRKTRTENDFFVAGDNGAGYLNPGMLREPRPISNVPSGWEAWIEHNERYYHQWDLSATGFIITGSALPMIREEIQYYQRFSPDGLAFQLDFDLGVAFGTPTIRMAWDLTGDVREAVDAIVQRAAVHSGTRPGFLLFRTILKTPSWHRAVVEGVRERLGDDRVEVVDMLTLFELIKLEHGR